MYRLEMTDDLGRLLSFPLKSAGIITVGRNRDNDIVLADKSVSRNHCLLHVAGERVEIEDLGSANGVIVHGALVDGRTKVQGGDEIIIGENRFFLRAVNEQETTHQTFLGPVPGLSKPR